jgi:hypothetical protein
MVIILNSTILNLFIYLFQTNWPNVIDENGVFFSLSKGATTLVKSN